VETLVRWGIVVVVVVVVVLKGWYTVDMARMPACSGGREATFWLA
jgi:hypothetical protein